LAAAKYTSTMALQQNMKTYTAREAERIKQWCQVISQKQASKFEKQAKNRQFNRKTSPKCVGRKIQQNEKSARKSNIKSGWQIRKDKPKMSKFSQKHAQYAFSSKLKRQKCHKIWEKSNLQIRTLQKRNPKNKQISIKTSPKTSNQQVFKKNATPQQNKPSFAGKTQGWQHCNKTSTRTWSPRSTGEMRSAHPISARAVKHTR